MFHGVNSKNYTGTVFLRHGVAYKFLCWRWRRRWWFR